MCIRDRGKDLPRIAMAHEIPYVATASAADLRDLEAKVHRAMSMRGARYIHVMVPCPLGWGTASGDTIKVARLATQSGIFPVFEADVYKRQLLGRAHVALGRQGLQRLGHEPAGLGRNDDVIDQTVLCLLYTSRCV